MYCESCNEPLACYEGEWYCPECTHVAVAELVRQADDEARACRLALAQAGRAVEPPEGDGPPF